MKSPGLSDDFIKVFYLIVCTALGNSRVVCDHDQYY